MQSAGIYEVEFDGSHLASGVYYCRMTAGTWGDVKRMVMIK
jgi:hypothetical protein